MEIERKFDVDDDAAVPSLHDLPGVGRVDPPVEYRLQAEYFDTEDFRLASRRITLRRRTGGEDAGWHLKIPVGPDERHEHHEPPGRKADGVPKALRDLIRVYVRDMALVPVARLTTRRSVHHLHGEDGGVLADLMDDRVQADVLLPAPASLHWREWEIELVDGSIDLLDAGQARVTDAGARPAAHSSKLDRALGPLLRTVADARPTPTPDGPAGDVLLAYLHEQLTVLEEQDPQVRQDAPDAVHRMRVATRRVRSVLGTYRSLLEDTDAVQLLREELKWLAGVLGRARDAEVMHARLKEMLAEEPAGLVLGPVERRVDLELGGGYRKAHDRALKALRGRRYFLLLDTLESLLAAPALTPRAAEPAARVIPELLNRDIRRLRAAVHEARHHPAGVGDHPALHQARKDAKRLRYAAEAADPVGRKKIARIGEAALGIQKILGEHQDSVVTRNLLRRLGVAAFKEGENGFTYGRLHALEQVAALRAESRFRREWKHFPSKLRAN
ncbi:CYTH and CHAD domain-containing protein [Arthrobacter sp. L77]|uniref:CYTH and CHAD domain-containing protein n=1 Tax=Arthrobacter sp. L77 TaxID=1496689 RepID=UPI00068E3B37|nr:CYTH and CHAD domain-containing protein [Arthrobacter sp. L77]